MKNLYERNFHVDYLEKEPGIWKVVSHLVDEQHDITLELEVSVPQMIILDARIAFTRYPLPQCVFVENKSRQLVGCNITTDYRSKILPLFMGPEGCPNLMVMLGSSAPGIPYFYYPHQLKTGQMSGEEWVEKIRTDFASDCLAHTLYNTQP